LQVWWWLVQVFNEKHPNLLSHFNPTDKEIKICSISSRSYWIFRQTWLVIMFTYFTEQSGREILHCWYLYLSTDFKSVTDELDHCRLSYVSLPDDLSVKPNFKDSQVENAINQIKIELTPVKEPEISHLRSRK